MDINIVFKLPPVFDYNYERYTFNSFLDRLLSFGVDSSKSDFYNTFDNGKEVFVCSFYFRNSFFNVEQLRQILSIESDILKKQKLDCTFPVCSKVGRKNKLSDEDVNKILNSNLPYRALASEFSCSIGLISKIKNSVHK